MLWVSSFFIQESQHEWKKKMIKGSGLFWLFKAEQRCGGRDIDDCGADEATELNLVVSAGRSWVRLVWCSTTASSWWDQPSRWPTAPENSTRSVPALMSSFPQNANTPTPISTRYQHRAKADISTVIQCMIVSLSPLPPTHSNLPITR